jgi:hypothetical protein
LPLARHGRRAGKGDETFDLKNADAQDVAKQLQDLGKDQDNNGGPYRFFYFGGGDNEWEGHQEDKHSWPIAAAMPFWCRPRPPPWRASPAPSPRWMNRSQDNSLAPKIVPVENVSAGDIEDVLNDFSSRKRAAILF